MPGSERKAPARTTLGAANGTDPTSRTEADWWNTEDNAATPLRDLVAGMDEIGSLMIPYARLPRRLGAYAQEFPQWSDIAGQSPHALLSRPKVGVAAVRALVQAAQDAVKTHRTTADAGSVGAEAAVARLVGQLDDFDRAILSARLWVLAACQVAREFPCGGERARYLSNATWTEAEPGPTRPMLSLPWDSA